MYCNSWFDNFMGISVSILILFFILFIPVAIYYEIKNSDEVEKIYNTCVNDGNKTYYCYSIMKGRYNKK